MEEVLVQTTTSNGLQEFPDWLLTYWLFLSLSPSLSDTWSPARGMICFNFPSLWNLVNNLYSSGSCYKPLSRGVFSCPFFILLGGYNSLFWAVGWVAFALAGQPLDPNRFFFETCWSSSTCLFWASTKTKGVDCILLVLCSTGSI